MFKALNVNTVPKLWEKRFEIFKESKVDLKDLEDVDSAGVAFLVQWAKATPEHKLTLINATPRLLKLISTFRLEELFEIQK